MTTHRLKTHTLLSLGFGLVLALRALTAGIAAWQMARLAANTEYYAVNLVPTYETQHDIAVALGDVRRLELIHILSNTTAEMDAAELQIAEARKTIAERVEHYERALVSDDEDRGLMQRSRQALEAYLAQWEKIRGISRLTTSDATQTAVATQLAIGESARAYEATHQAIRAWWTYNVKLANAQTVESRDIYADARLQLGALVGLALAIGVASAVVIVRHLVRQLGGEPGDAAALASAIADGDLGRRSPVKAGDDASLMARLAEMQAQLQRVVSGVRQNAESVATASAQISQGNQDLSSRTEEQASALQQTAATMEQLSSTVRNNADSARQANQLAQGAADVAAQGGVVVGQVVSTMQGISESSRRIGDIIGVIDGIAFQTNILALNAAVEAARAGEQGRGFAVVASEVRSLAQRSAEAAREIKTLIGRSVEQVEAGSGLVARAGKTMGEIVQSIQRVRDTVGEITAASTEQSNGVQQVSEAVSRMDQATQQNAALVEESAAAAESLKTQARQLVQAVAVFRLDGASPASAVAAGGAGGSSFGAA